MATGPAGPDDLKVLSGLGPELASAFVSLASDIALVIDVDGVIRNVAVGSSGPALSARGWIGRPWVETVTGETRRKIELMLQEAGSGGVVRRREVNHPSQGGADIPISYAALRLGAHGPVIAVGRDLSAVATIQQRFIDAQQEMERDYWKLRQAQNRQRLIAQVASDAVMVVDAASLKVLDANPAAADLFGPAGTAAPLPAPIEELLLMARRTGRSAEVRTRLGPPGAGAQIDLSATPFRAAAAHGETSLRLLVRARSAVADGTAPDGQGVVVTDSNGRVVMANASFTELCRGAGSETSIQGQPLTELLGDPQRHLSALLSEVRRAGLALSPSMPLGGGAAPTFEAEVRAALLADGDQECIGLTLRRLDSVPPNALPSALQALVGHVGRIPLSDLMRQASEVAERHAISTALRRTADDLARAAELLGISPDDLADRVRSLGLGRQA